jgi:hypothetical protein
MRNVSRRGCGANLACLDCSLMCVVLTDFGCLVPSFQILFVLFVDFGL